MASVLSTAGLASASARRPWRVVGAWVLALVLALVAAATLLGGALTSEVSFTGEPESLKGLNLLEDRMPQLADPVSETIVFRSETATVDDAAFKSLVAETTAGVRALPGVTVFNAYEALANGDAAGQGLISQDRHATLIPVTFAATFDDAADQYDAYARVATAKSGAGFQVLTVGDLSIDDEFNGIAEQDLQTAEGIGLPIALVILVGVFGALIAAGLPVALALMSIVIAVGLAALVGQLTDLSFFVVNMITMIGLAVGIDYALFIVDRYREERRRGLQKLDAISIAGATASRAVLFSGITVVLALTGMLLIPTTIFRSLGIGAILAVVVAVLATLTLIPAMLSLLGDRIDWPRRRRYDAETVARQASLDAEMYHGGFWGRVTRLVMARPVVSLALGVILLLAAALPYFDLQRGQAGVATLPDSDVKSAFAILNRDFGAGRLAPVEVVVDGVRGTDTDAAIERLSAALRTDSNYAEVGAPVWNDAGDLALITASLSMDSNAPEAYAEISQLRQSVVPAAFDGTDATALVTGETAFNADFFTVVDDWTPIVFAFVLGLSFLLLLLVFRSIVIAAKAIILNLLSVGAAYGLMVLVFQKGVGTHLLGFQKTPTIEAWIPIFLFCVLFGLSMDYHVFLLSRIKEHFDLTGRNAESVAVGLQSTARIITGAALIMVVVFTGFAMGQLVMFQQMGFGLAVAVLLDATIVRSILVPAAMALLGRWNWYLPSWLQWLPNLSVEAPRRPDVARGSHGSTIVPEGAAD